ncbi:S41 family peptidase [Enterococcus durans]|uniref:S41 family peptidase n=1 Tax=Enterococcus durans TaxID=53345 RepID=UPI00142F469E|nr:S41 family peptidase [Enterococcus durans]
MPNRNTRCFNRYAIKGVIIDLTSNNGGDSNVLLASVSQFLPNGNLLTFKGKHYSVTLNLSDTKIKTGNYSYQIKNYPKLNVPVSVMESNITGSSAEILLLAITTTVKESTFIGRDTGGYVSGREGYKLYGNYYLGLPTEVIQTNDKIVHKIDSPISSDIQTDAPLATAKEWFSKFTLSTNK